MKPKNRSLYPPLIFNVFKPARMSSYDVVRHFKRHLPMGFGKIGHFGTLDPFASGVLMIGIGGAARLNDFIHDQMPKTYLGVGKLGVETPTGDYTGEIIQRDETLFLTQEIGSFSKEFIEERIQRKFLGVYMQPPHKYSAAKFMGKNLHEWAREGIEIKKEPVRRFIHSLTVVKYQFPYLSIRATVSSGTYIRTLFTDICQDLGTIGTLIALSRESVGHIKSSDGIHKNVWPRDKNPESMKLGIPVVEVLPFPKVILDERQTKSFKNGAFFKPVEFPEIQIGNNIWMSDEGGKLLGLAHRVPEGEIRPKINFCSDDQATHASDGDPQ